MGRHIFKGIIFTACLMGIKSDLKATAVVHDPTSFLSFAEMIKSGAEQVETAKEFASTAKESLSFVTESLDELKVLNSVLGNPISDKFIGKLNSAQGVSDEYEGYLFDVSSDHGDGLGGVNRFANKNLGTRDQSQLLTAKSYMQDKYFAKTESKKVNLMDAKKIRLERESAAEDSLLTSLAISKNHKESLPKDHKDLTLISKAGKESNQMNHQSLTQTKLLERIAQNLEKLILLQAQQLDFMAKTYMGDRGIGLGDSSASGRK